MSFVCLILRILCRWRGHRKHPPTCFFGDAAELYVCERCEQEFVFDYQTKLTMSYCPSVRAYYRRLMQWKADSCTPVMRAR